MTYASLIRVERVLTMDGKESTKFSPEPLLADRRTSVVILDSSDVHGGLEVSEKGDRYRVL